ncbi:hypothetical protein SLA2020_270120 [Shorea laevis]
MTVATRWSSGDHFNARTFETHSPTVTEGATPPPTENRPPQTAQTTTDFAGNTNHDDPNHADTSHVDTNRGDTNLRPENIVEPRKNGTKPPLMGR